MVQAQNVDIPDPNLRASINGQFGRAPDARVTLAHLRVCILDATFPNKEPGYAEEWAQDKVAQLHYRALVFDKSEESDTYLFCVWCRDKGEGKWHFELKTATERSYR